ncbi:cullin-4A [Trichonephila clavipes]|nr:cullin-4A [Trichonephila clavipes]
MQLELGLNPGKGMDVCKCIVPPRHGGTLNSHLAASHLVRLVEEEGKWEVPDHSQGVLPQNWSGTEKNRTVTFMVLIAKANYRRKNLAHSRDECRGS